MTTIDRLVEAKRKCRRIKARFDDLNGRCSGVREELQTAQEDVNKLSSQLSNEIDELAKRDK